MYSLSKSGFLCQVGDSWTDDRHSRVKAKYQRLFRPPNRVIEAVFERDLALGEHVAEQVGGFEVLFLAEVLSDGDQTLQGCILTFFLAQAATVLSSEAQAATNLVDRKAWFGRVIISAGFLQTDQVSGVFERLLNRLKLAEGQYDELVLAVFLQKLGMEFDHLCSSSFAAIGFAAMSYPSYDYPVFVEVKQGAIITNSKPKSGLITR